jgi:hypothetical protein
MNIKAAPSSEAVAVPAPIPLLRRALMAAPDAATAALFLYGWLRPLGWHHDLVKNLILVILMEFLVVHSAGFLGMTLLNERSSRARKSVTLVGLSAFYMLFVVGFCLGMDAWWPVPVFLWLLGAKFVSVWFGPTTTEQDRVRMLSQWGMAVGFYLLAVFVGILVPLPRLGLTPAVVGQLGLPGGGEWIDRPHTALSAGFIYFSLLALMKFRDWTLDVKNPQEPGR